MKILLVDDTKTDRMIMTAYLEKLGHEVIIGENGEQAVALYSSESPDLVLLDVIMPVMDGYEAAQEMRRSHVEWVPIIFLSARVSADDVATGIDAGGDDYLTKPVEHDVLKAKMKAMQRIARMRQRLIKVSSDLETANKELKQLVNVDGLTGIANRRFMDQHLSTEYSRSMRYSHTICFVLADVDFFKLYNDHFGHLEGDDCLKKIGQLLNESCQRSTDLAARYGGEEFALVLPDTPLDAAEKIAENCRAAVEALQIPHPQSEVGVCTLSMGVACSLPGSGDTIENMLQRADEALYRAKAEGRNRIISKGKC